MASTITPESKVDRLSALPPELLAIIFSHVKLNRAPSWGYLPLYISKRLLPYTRPLVFTSVKIRTWPGLNLFIHTISAQPFLGGYVRKLNVDFDLEDDNVRLPRGLDTRPKCVKFWSALDKLEEVRFGTCLPVLLTLLSLVTCEEEFSFNALEYCQVRDPFKDWPNPYSFTYYEPLFLLAPYLVTFSLGVFYDDDPERLEEYVAEEETPLEDDYLPGLCVVQLYGSLNTTRAPQIARLCNHSPILKVLELDHYGDDPGLDEILDRLHLEQLELISLTNDGPDQAEGISADFKKFAALKELEVSTLSDYNPALLGRLPDSLTTLTHGFQVTITATDLRALLGSAASLPSALKHLGFDGLPGRMSFRDAVRPGPRIAAGPVPALAADAAGEPVFEPLPGWALPEWTGAWRPDLGFEDLMRVREQGKKAGLTFGGRLFECVSVQEGWDAEVALCARLEEQHERGELQWVKYDGPMTVAAESNTDDTRPTKE